MDIRHVVLLGEPNEFVHQLDANGRNVQQEIGIDIVDAVKQAPARETAKNGALISAVGQVFPVSSTRNASMSASDDDSVLVVDQLARKIGAKTIIQDQEFSALFAEPDQAAQIVLREVSSRSDYWGSRGKSRRSVIVLRACSNMSRGDSSHASGNGHMGTSWR